MDDLQSEEQALDLEGSSLVEFERSTVLSSDADPGKIVDGMVPEPPKPKRRRDSAHRELLGHDFTRDL